MAPKTRGKKITYKEADSDSDADEKHGRMSDAEIAPPKRKRAKKATQTDASFVETGDESKKPKDAAVVRRRGGKLRNLMLMPIDIFTEICAYLHPKDLRALSLTTKGLRSILMSKTARHIWKACLESVPDLPECPSDLNEPQYVRLMFTSECFDCGTHCGLYDYYHRVRFCDHCFKTNLLHDYQVNFEPLPDIKVDRYQFPYMNLFSSIAVLNTCRRHNRNRRGRFHYQPSITSGIIKYAEVRATGDQEALNALKAEVTALHEMKLKTANTITQWKQAEYSEKRLHQDEIKQEHERSIIDKLLTRGWTEEDIPQWNHQWNSLARKPKRLTENAYTKILPRLEEILTECRKSRLERERFQRLDMRGRQLYDRYQKLVKAEIHPEGPGNTRLIPDREMFLARPEVDAIYKDDSEQQSGVTDDQWETIEHGIRLWARTQRWRRLRVLVSILDGEDKPDPKEAVPELESMIASEEEMAARLSLATSVFLCKSCPSKHAVWCPPLGYHWCIRDDFENNLVRGPADLVEAICRDFEKNPAVATAAELCEPVDGIRAKLLCRRCDERSANYFDLSDLVDHYMKAENWFKKANGASSKSSEPSVIIHTHDWTRDAPLVRKDGANTINATKTLMRQFVADGRAHPRGEERRGCRACPEGYRYWTRLWNHIELHVETVHGRELDPETDVIIPVSGSEPYDQVAPPFL